MQALLGGFPSIMNPALKVEESQLLELSCRAKKAPAKEGFLCKVDVKGKKVSEKWCLVYRNLMFYYETASCNKPTGVVLLEGCHCYQAVVAEVAHSDCPPNYDIENGLSIGYQRDSICRHYLFICNSSHERNEWITVINNSSMSKLQNDLEALKIRCQHLESKAISASAEVNNLRQQQSDAQGDIASLRATLTTPMVKRSKSLGNALVPLDSSVFLSFQSKAQMEIEDESARILQTHIRGWLIRRRWKRVVRSYIDSPHSSMMKKRNQLIWKLIASEEDYVSQLTVLRGEFQQQLMIAACSLRQYLSLKQCIDIFRNCDELSLFHQLYLRALHRAVEKWPVVNLGEVFKLFTPMLAVYHQYIGNHRYSLEVLFELKLRPHFKAFLQTLEKKPACKEMSLEELLTTPLNRISVYIQEIEELRANTPTEHVDYHSMSYAISELEMIQKTVTDEVSFSESVRQVLAVERKIEGGCEVLLDKEQSLIRKGFLVCCRGDERGLRKSRKLSTYCFLFSKHFLVTQRLPRKKEELYRIQKDVGILHLAKCRVRDTKLERADARFLGIVIEYENGSESKQEFQFLAMGVSEKAQWMADIAQCIVNEKENVILESQSKGELVELSSNFIRYSTFRAGKEQLVNSGNLKNLFNRLIRISYMGLEFLNTFLMTFQLYTSSDVVMDYLIKSYKQVMETRSIKRTAMSPEEQVKEARAKTLNGGVVGSHSSHSLTMTHPVTFPRRSPNHMKAGPSQTEQPLTSVTGIFFALKHWVSKHFYHFQSSSILDSQLQGLLELANECTMLTNPEKRAVSELTSMFSMQKKGEYEPICPIMEFMNNVEHTSQRPFSVLLQWEPKVVAEQLCLIDSVLFCRIDNDELLRYINSSNKKRPESSPNVVCFIQHFNRMSLFWMWSVAKQANDTDRTKMLELLILTAAECIQLSNFMSMMEIVAALEHGCVLRFSTAWSGLSKVAKQQHRVLKKISSTDGRYKELREAVKRATPPVIPYLAVTLTELVSIKEAMHTYLDGELVNFSKMRRLTKTVNAALQHQKDPYDFVLSSQLTKMLLTTPVLEDQEALYCYVDSLKASKCSQLNGCTS